MYIYLNEVSSFHVVVSHLKVLSKIHWFLFGFIRVIQIKRTKLWTVKIITLPLHQQVHQLLQEEKLLPNRYERYKCESHFIFCFPKQTAWSWLVWRAKFLLYQAVSILFFFLAWREIETSHLAAFLPQSWGSKLCIEGHLWHCFISRSS